MPATMLVLMPVRSGDVLGDLPVRMSEQCATCRHLAEAATCAAFPDGIPQDIWSGSFDHTRAHEGDHGVRYAPIHAAAAGQHAGE